MKVETVYNAEFGYLATDYYIKKESILSISEKSGSFSKDDKSDFQIVSRDSINAFQSGYELLEFIDTNFHKFTIVYDLVQLLHVPVA